MDKKSEQNEYMDAKDVILDLNFVPQWARKEPGQNHYKDSDRKERRPSSRSSRPDNYSSRRPPNSDHHAKRPPSNRSNAAARPVRPVREPIRELPITVSFLPEQKRLASLVRQICHSRRAYPLMDLANLFIHDEDGYLVKVEVDKGTSNFSLFKCKTCKAVTSTEELMQEHLLAEHLTDVYDREEIETDAPSGVFVCVARCRKSGVLLGPPNHHNYTDKLNELHQSKFAHLSLDQYKEQIETVHDEELIEQWKEESRKQVVYKLKSDPEAEGITHQKAEKNFKKQIASMYETTHRSVMSSKAAQKINDPSIKHSIRKVWGKESRFPLSMSFSMRAAFRHMHLYLFKAGKINFVTHIKSNPIQPEDTVENIAEVLRFLKENPGSTRLNLIKSLYPTLDPKSEEAKEVLKPLSWLIERGHIVEFFNGTLALPLGKKRAGNKS